MGSKSFMLANGLGTLIKRRSNKATRIVDLFSGAAHIAWFAATETNKPVLAVDLQNYSRILAEAIISRKTKLDSTKLKKVWLDNVERALTHSSYYSAALKLEAGGITRNNVEEARRFCEKNKNLGVVWRAYGGYYFSPSQALIFDLMRKYLPPKNPNRSVCLASIIIAASKCVAAPGHTAQPFQPTKGAKKFLKEAWSRNPIALAKDALEEVSLRHAKKVGKATTADALEVAKKLRKHDLVIIDPPYSGVQYSRFYHVLETIANGKCGKVGGIGRYPSMIQRPQSPFSNKSESQDALKKLLGRIARRSAEVIFTFPARKTSNGLSGKIIEDTAKEWFNVSRMDVYYRYSTLGGNNHHRKAQRMSKELILTLIPKKMSA
jgi:adenine-specific DNA methylase